MLFDGQITVTNEIAHRLISLLGVRAAVPTVPFSDEGLADFIFRSASLNGYLTTDELMRSNLKRPLSHNLMAMRTFDLARIADLLGLPNGATDIVHHNYSASRTSGRGGNSLIDFFGSKLSAKQLINHRRVSPRALRIANHSRAIWHLNSLCFDPETQEMLLNNCPACGKQLNFKFSCGVSHCSACGPEVDLRDFPQPLVNVADRDALRFVSDLIDPNARTRKIHPERLRVLDSGEVFMLCVLIGAILDDALPVNHLGRLLPITGTAVTPKNLARAGRAVMTWPSGFSDIAADLNQSALFAGRDYDREPLEAFLRQTKIFSADAMKAIRTGSRMPARRAKSPATVVDMPQTSRIDTNSLRRLFDISRKADAVKSLCNDVGMPPRVLFDCFVKGSLRCPIAEVAAWLPTGPSSLSEVNNGISVVRRKGRHTISVQGAVSALYHGLGNPWPAIIDGLKSGELPVVRKAGRGPWLGRLFVQDYAAWADYCGRLRPAHECVDFPMLYEDIGFYLDLRMDTVRGTLGSFYRLQMPVTPRVLHRFRSEYMSVREIRNHSILAGAPVSELTITRMLNARGLQCCPFAPSYRYRPDVELLYRIVRPGSQ